MRLLDMEAVVDKVIDVTELQRRFQSVLDEVVRERIPYVLSRGNGPEAALIPYEQFRRYQEQDRQEALDRLDRELARLVARNAEATDEDVAADVAAMIQEVRASPREATS